jgi:hypothetical protein
LIERPQWFEPNRNAKTEPQCKTEPQRKSAKNAKDANKVVLSNPDRAVSHRFNFACLPLLFLRSVRVHFGLVLAYAYDIRADE